MEDTYPYDLEAYYTNDNYSERDIDPDLYDCCSTSQMFYGAMEYSETILDIIRETPTEISVDDLPF